MSNAVFAHGDAVVLKTSVVDGVIAEDAKRFKVDAFPASGEIFVVEDDGAAHAYAPAVNGIQCLEAVPVCHVMPVFIRSIDRPGFSCCVSGNLWWEHESELIARCLALVGQIYGNAVPDYIYLTNKPSI
jgi:hypothetical protein